MKNKEIEELLNELKCKDNYSNFIDSQYGGNDYYYLLEIQEAMKLLSYIEQLEDKINWYENIDINKTIDKFRVKHNEEIKELHNKIEQLEKENEKIRMRNDMLRKDIDSFIKDNKIDYKARIYKAIEYNQEIVDNYLKEDDCEYCDGRYNVAKKNLSILKGGIDE